MLGKTLSEAAVHVIPIKKQASMSHRVTANHDITLYKNLSRKGSADVFTATFSHQEKWLEYRKHFRIANIYKSSYPRKQAEVETDISWVLIPFPDITTD
ncbi:MAG: hypothetical protein JSC189_000410 [Candidatus Tokpelaia sp. JSC189]|nr:MAG: hypothetical protein JSC189_000410 [Candidatus Tokpelaia sp. JSC189]